MKISSEPRMDANERESSRNTPKYVVRCHDFIARALFKESFEMNPHFITAAIRVYSRPFAV